MNSAIQIGKVSDAKRARYHAIVDGTAPCHSGHGKILVVGEKYQAIPLTPATAEKACGHAACRKAIRAQIDAAKAANVTESSGPRRWRAENELIALAERFESDADKAFRADMVARLTTPVSPIFPVQVVPATTAGDLLDYLPNAA